MCKSFPTIEINGSILKRDSQRFFVRGLVYQPYGYYFGQELPRSLDPLRDECIDTLRRDIVVFKELGINALFVYRFDLEEPHEKTIEALLEAGIYLVINLSGPRHAINRMKPRESYTRELLELYCAKIDALSKFPNIIAACVANGIVNNGVKHDSANVIREVIRIMIGDLKFHMRMMKAEHGHRILPLCINDSSEVPRAAATFGYHTSTSEPDSAADLYMLTNYDSCEKENSKWDQMGSAFSHSSVPILISEYGYNITRPRQFNEVDRLYSSEFSKTFSGGFIYEYHEGVNQFGLVKVDKTGELEKLPDFENLKNKLLQNRPHDDGTEP